MLLPHLPNPANLKSFNKLLSVSRLAMVGIVVGIALSACGSSAIAVIPSTGDGVAAVVAKSTANPTAKPKSTTAANQSSGFTINYPQLPTKGLQKAKVSHVVDGDTFDAIIGGDIKRIRVLGINTPESVDPRRPVQCFGLEASARAKVLLKDQTVYLETDPVADTIDQYGRLLRFVWFSDGRLYNMEIVAEGYASEYTFQGQAYKYQREFKSAQRDAARNNRGLWSPSTCAGDFMHGVTK